jgi:hypothetical protein
MSQKAGGETLGFLHLSRMIMKNITYFFAAAAEYF